MNRSDLEFLAPEPSEPSEPCRDWGPRVCAWFDDEISEFEAEEVRCHLLDCSGCRGAVARWGSLRDELETLQPEEADSATLDRMTVRFQDSLASEVYALSRGLQLWRSAAALLLVAGASLFAADRLFVPGVVRANRPSEIDHAVEQLIERGSHEVPPGPAAPPDGRAGPDPETGDPEAEPDTKEAGTADSAGPR